MEIQTQQKNLMEVKATELNKSWNQTLFAIIINRANPSKVIWMKEMNFFNLWNSIFYFRPQNQRIINLQNLFRIQWDERFGTLSFYAKHFNRY